MMHTDQCDYRCSFREGDRIWSGGGRTPLEAVMETLNLVRPELIEIGQQFAVGANQCGTAIALSPFSAPPADGQHDRHRQDDPGLRRCGRYQGKVLPIPIQAISCMSAPWKPPKA
jgi:hypothetical protein